MDSNVKMPPRTAAAGWRMGVMYGIDLRRIVLAAAALIFLLFTFSLRGRAQPQETPPNDLVRQVVSNELNAEDQDHSHWMFRLETEKNAQKDIDDVVETKSGDLQYPVLINGRELTPEQQQESDKRVDQVVHHPEMLRKSLQDKTQDAARSQRLLKMLPDAFMFSYGQRRGDLVQLSFTPNPHFRPPSREAEVFHAMEGSLVIDSKQRRVAEIRGRLMREVKFGGGLLGHLDKGGTFEVKQEPVAPGYWELTDLNVRMNGKVLFFKTISVHQSYFRSNFMRLGDDLTLAQAAEILHKQVSSH